MMSGASSRTTRCVPGASRVRLVRPERRHECRPGGPDRVDIALAASVLVLGPGIAIPTGRVVPAAHPWVALLAGVVVAAVLLWRRRHPEVVTLVTAGLLAVAPLVGVRFTPWVSNAGPALAVAVFSLAALRPRSRSIPVAAAAVVVASVGGLLALTLGSAQDQDAVQLVLVVPAVLLGDAVRVRAEHAAAMTSAHARERAEHEALIRAEERLHISREVHDVVSHSLSTVAVRAGVARVLLDQDPDEARHALAVIESITRGALEEVRAVLRGLRDSTSDAHEPTSATLRDLPRLVSRMRAEGLTIAVHDEERATSPVGDPLIETSAFRIVQEALTNVVKHAPGAGVEMTIRLEEESLHLDVRDDGRGGPGTTTSTDGLGLQGMHERAALHGGSLSAGPDGGGFRVHAILPTRRAAR